MKLNDILKNINNYTNLNFDENQTSISKNNPFKNVSKGFKFIVLALVILILALNSTYQVKEQEQAVILTLGKPTGTTGSGLHFKIPFIQKIEKVNTTIKG